MSITRRVARMVVAAGVLTALSFGFASSAGAAASASWTSGNGAVTVTYSGVVNGSDEIDMLFLPQGSTCVVQGNPYVNWLYLLNAGNAPVQMAASPATVTAGTNAMGPGGPQAVQIPAGTYQACLYSVLITGGNPSWLLQQSGQVTLGQVTPSTTASTTTTAAADPVAPAFTG